jgi:acetyltransferase
VSSHTGALAGSGRAFDAAVRQAGALRVGTLEELFDVARALVTGRRPPGRRVILLTNGGGLGILATDAARDAGLDVSSLSPSTRARLSAVLPATRQRRILSTSSVTRRLHKHSTRSPVSPAHSL